VLNLHHVNTKSAPFEIFLFAGYFSISNGLAGKAKGERFDVASTCWGWGQFMEEAARCIVEAVRSVKGGPGGHESAEIVFSRAWFY